jgi:HSP20 family protein
MFMKSLMSWDPFGTVKKWDPFEEMRSMQREMDKLFDRFLGVELPIEHKGVWVPSVECYTKDGKIVFRAELPGIDAKDLDVSITDRELVIKGERKHEKDAKEENYAYREISYGAFERHFALPEGVKTDELKAKFKDGILEVTVPAPTSSKARKIEIETSKEDKKLIEGESRKAA